MNIRKTIKLPETLKSNTEAALAISCIALLLAAVALFAASHRGDR